MDSSIVPRKRRLINDYFSPAHAPVRSTPSDRIAQAQVSASSAAGPSTSKRLMRDEIPDSEASDGDGMPDFTKWRNLGSFKSPLKIPADDMVGKALEPYDSVAELDDSDIESAKEKKALESDPEYSVSDEEDDDDDEIANQTDPSPEKGDSSQLDNSVAVFCSSADFKRPFAKDIPIDCSLRAMNPSYWKAFRDLDIDTWLEKYLKAIPEQVQALFEKESWSFDVLFALPSFKKIPKRQGVYGIFFQSEHHGQEKEMGYVGAAPTGLKKRFDAHNETIRYTRVGTVHSSKKDMCLYRHAGRSEFPFEFSFKVLAVFDGYTEQSYVYMLEGIFMVLLRTFYLLFENKTNTQASFDLFNQSGELLPDAEAIAKRNRRRDEKQGLIDPICDGCHRPKSEIIKDNSHNVSTQVLINSLHKDGKRYCMYCYNFVKQNKEEPSSEEIGKLFRGERIRRALEKGEYKACQNCGFTPPLNHSDESDEQKLKYHKPTEKVLCFRCREHYSGHGTLRVPFADAVQEKRRQIKEAENRGETIKCYLCPNTCVKGKAVVSQWAVGPVCQRRRCLASYKAENARLKALHAS
ncbi:uncharacterized protein TRUGW13939_09894 [Talaromyces rugulosus]|uniref:Uncharacterized protein n=1 Tax=Talaromyces rugulosus TaxID=121627 RepID=A0A7H8R8L5_TALRU|nr:uncharacterized protein TRUGW13939_09894 [Talaromyces rugulosus]QKX62732.1 hypothetical protein TRUGW13939_09894 [Talaromyces rugulosus]